MIERRSSRRVEGAVRVEAKLYGSLPARVVDLSAGGVLIEVARQLPLRASLDLRFPNEGGDVVVKATVKRCQVQGKGRLAPAGGEVLLYRAALVFERPLPALPDLISASETGA
jgi:hypothetical protein